MPLDWSPLVDFVRRRQRLLLTTHVRPDGDGLGSMLALAECLRAQGKSVGMTVASTVPPRYDFLDPEHSIKKFNKAGDAWREFDGIIVLDTGTFNQLGDFADFLRTLPVERLGIDHHPTQANLGGLALVDTTAEATGRLVYEAIMTLGGKLSAKSANNLFVAVAMDTGWFRHSNTTAATLALTGEFVKAGARPDLLYEELFEHSTVGRLKLIGVALGRLQVVAEGKVAYTEIHKGDYAATGAQPQDSEELVNFTRGIDGVEVGLLFMEQPVGGIKVSFRSRSKVDVGKVAERFNGGGHRLASGAIIQAPLPEARARVLDAVQTALGSAC